MAVLPVSNIINVTITNTPSGLAERNVNNIGLFTTETPDNFDIFTTHVGASTVGEMFGTSSETYRMAVALFSQSPNIRTGNGRLTVIPMQAAVSATSGDFVTADIAANLASIIAVTSGDIRVVIDGTNYDLTGLNFTAATSFADISAILQARLVAATVEPSANGFTITSKSVGTTSTVDLAAVSGGTGVALSGSGYFNAAGGTDTAGTNAAGETLLQAIARVDGTAPFVGVMTNLAMQDAVFATTANAIQAMDKIFVHHFASIGAIAGAATTNSQAANKKTRPLLYTTSLESANLMKAAYVGRGFSVNFSGSNTSSTMNLKQLATITPDAGVTQTRYDQANTAGIDMYVSYDGVPSVFSTEGNDFFDNVYSDLALKFALETAGFNYLRQTNTKVPQTEQGMNGLKAAYAAVLDRFVRNGSIAPGSWTSSETFGDPEIFRENVLNRGYYIYSLPIVQQSSVEREQRKAPLVQIAVKRAGAIHTSDVIVVIND